LNKFCTWAVFYFILITSNIFAQINIAVVKKDSSITEWTGSLKAEGTYRKGNTNYIFGFSEGEIKRADGILETILAAKLTYGESDGIKDENELRSSFTIDLFYKNIFSPFLLQQTDFNYAREIDLRSQSGAGLKYTFIDIRELKASISAAGIYDYTNLKERPGNSDSRTWRLSARLKFKTELFGSRIKLSHYTFYQPSFKDFNNTIWRSESELSAPLTEFLAVTSTYSYSHEAVVPAGVKKEDQQLTFGIEINFE
jgi:hypothetical protein